MICIARLMLLTQHYTCNIIDCLIIHLKFASNCISVIQGCLKHPIWKKYIWIIWKSIIFIFCHSRTRFMSWFMAPFVWYMCWLYVLFKLIVIFHVLFIWIRWKVHGRCGHKIDIQSTRMSMYHIWHTKGDTKKTWHGICA